MFPLFGVRNTADPDNIAAICFLSLAMRRTGSVVTAKSMLLQAVEVHPSASQLHYDLACCECLLGEIETAKVRLEHACRLQPAHKMMALDEEDSRAIW